MLAKLLNKGKLHYAWILLAACCLFELALQGVFSYGSGIFYVPVSLDLGTTVGTFSVSATVYGLAMSLFSPVAGRLFSPKHFRLQLAAAAAVMSLCYMLLSRATAVWHWILAMAVIGMCGSFLIILPVPILVNNWFDRHAGVAVSVISAFSGLSGAIVSPLGAKIILASGWRAAYRILGLGSALLAIPAILLFVCYSPEQVGMEPYGKSEVTASKATSPDEQNNKPISRSLVILVMLAASLISVFKSFYNHYSAFSVSIGLSAMTGARLMSIIMIGTVVFRLLLGILNDRIGIQKTVYLSLGLMMLSLLCAALLHGSFPLLLIGTFLLGVGPAMMSVLPALMTRAVCARREYARVFPLVTMAYTLTAALSNSVIGFLYDTFSSYVPAMLLGVGIAALAALLSHLVFRQSNR